MAVQIPIDIVHDAQTADSQLWPLLLAIAVNEDGSFDPAAQGDNGCSIGLEQFNRCGGLGQGYSVAYLSDPVNNFRLAAQDIRAAMANGASLYDALQPWSTRDADMATYRRILSEGIAGVPNVPALPGTVGGPTGPSVDSGPSAGSFALLAVVAVVALAIVG